MRPPMRLAGCGGARFSSFPQLLDSLGTTYQEIDQSADPVGEDDDQNPNDLGVALVGFFHRTINQRPNPKNSQRQTQTTQEKKKEFESAENSCKHKNPLSSLDCAEE